MARNTQPPEGDPVVPDTPEADAPPTDEAALEAMTVPELEAEAAARGVQVTDGSGADGSVVKADLVDALTVDIDELEAQRQAALADAETASARANELHTQIVQARGTQELQAAGLAPLIQVAEASAAAVTATPVED